MSGGATPVPDDADARHAGPSGTAHGPGRALVLVYGLLAVAATARSGVQIARDLAEAPLAYALSAVAALVYVVATVALARGRGVWRVVAWVAVAVELVGVLAVGALSVARPELFPEATVWSRFGAGYGYVPLVLPVLGLLWLRRTAPADVPAAGGRASRGGGTAAPPDGSGNREAHRSGGDGR